VSNFTLKIDTCELTEALYALAKAISSAKPQETPKAPIASLLPHQPEPVAQPAPTAPTQPAIAQQPPANIPTSAPTYNLEQLAVAATPLIDAGRQAELVDLLSQFGVQALTQLPKERYGEFAQELRRLGAII